MTKIVERWGVVRSVDMDKKKVVIVAEGIGETEYVVHDSKLLQKLSGRVGKKTQYIEKDGQIDDVKGNP